MRGAGHVEEKPVAAPTKCLAACPQHTLFVERPAMSLRTRKLGPTQRSSRVPEKTANFGKFNERASLLRFSSAVIVGISGAARIGSHDFWSILDFVALGSGT
jgi:hypothetical protein